MYDMCVAAMAAALVAANVTTLRFNFRSFGLACASGLANAGSLHADDVRGAVDFVNALEGGGPERVVLIGYSYGALMTLEVAPSIDSVVAFVAIAPPLGCTWPLIRLRDVTSRATRSTKPKLLLLE